MPMASKKNGWDSNTIAVTASVLLTLLFIATLLMLQQQDVPNDALRGHRKQDSPSPTSTSKRRLQDPGDSTIIIKLPDANQKWAHEVNSQAEIDEVVAAGKQKYTAIESDLLLGTCTTYADTTAIIPISAHPPDTTSDVSVESLLDQFSTPRNDENSNDRVLTRIVKLDFKEIGSVEPTLEAVLAKKINTASNNKEVFFINADVVPGPGYRFADIELDAEVMIPIGLDKIRRQIAEAGRTNMAWSLSFRTRYESPEVFKAKDFEDMNDIIIKYDLLNTPNNGVGVVVAINARQLSRRLDLVTSNFLQGGFWENTSVDQIQVLAWTGRSELPIPKSTVEQIRGHFRNKGLEDRVGFDVSTINSNFLGGILDVGIRSYGWVVYAIDFLTI